METSAYSGCGKWGRSRVVVVVAGWDENNTVVSFELMGKNVVLFDALFAFFHHIRAIAVLKSNI